MAGLYGNITNSAPNWVGLGLGLSLAIMYWISEGDLQSVTGHNVKLIENETLMDPSLAPLQALKQKIIENVPPVPNRDRWRLGYLEQLLVARGEAYYAGQDTGGLTTLIDSLCSG